METFPIRLRRLRVAAGLSQEQLALACGYSGQSRIANYESTGASARLPKITEIPALAQALGVSISDLFKDSSHAEVREDAGKYVKERSGFIRFPLLEGFAGMGRGEYIGDFPEIVDFVEVTREWAAQALRGTALSNIRVITGRGNSNAGLYNDGDLLFIDSSVKEFSADDIYCYRWDGRVQIKRLQWIGGGMVRVISANKEYPAIDVPLKDLEIGGLVVTGWTLIKK